LAILEDLCKNYDIGFWSNLFIIASAKKIMHENLYDYELQPEKRTSFLTWLCILSFIGSGWTIISSIYTYTTAYKYAGILSKRSEIKKDTVQLNSRKGNVQKEGMSEKVKTSFSKILQKENMRKLALGNLVASLFTLCGAIFMWNLKKIGFYLYIFGVIVSLLVPFYIFRNDMIAVGATSFNNFFGLIFIALYALNLKLLKS